jgi:hypothetical protein
LRNVIVNPMQWQFNNNKYKKGVAKINSTPAIIWGVRSSTIMRGKLDILIDTFANNYYLQVLKV